MIDSDEEFFEDAVEVQAVPTEMDLVGSLLEARMAVNLFLNNDFEEARNLLKPFVGKSMYHTMGNAVFDFLEAILNFEASKIEKASASLKLSVNLCNFYRKKNTFQESIGKIVKRSNYDSLTPCEIHAELCYAESIMLKSALALIEDETLVSFIKAGLKIRTCFNSYKVCHSILKYRKWTEADEEHKVHFESGVRFGVGAFNLMVSHLPARVVKLLEFMGFYGSRERGLAELEAGYRLSGVRQVLCSMTLLTYHLIVVYLISPHEGDLALCEEILAEQLQAYPEGAWFLYYRGRLEFVKGRIEEANTWFTRSWRSQEVWPQFHHMCFWELMWTHAMLLNWPTSAKFARKLLRYSKWSTSVYGYHRMAALLMMDLTQESRDEISTLVELIPASRQRIAGKSLPMEKFCVRRCERFIAQNNYLVIPAIELLYLWNCFKILAKNWQICQAVYKVIIKASRVYEVRPPCEYDADNRALLHLLEGAILHQMGQPLQAEEALRHVAPLSKAIKVDSFLVPFAQVELAMVRRAQGDTARAIQILEDVKKNYTGYSLESRLHFRIHAALLELSSKRS